MHAVSNTSPLIFLESLDVLFLLDRCFEKVIIADAVYREWGPSSIPSFVEHYHLSEKGQAFVSGAMGRLHQGELETVVLANEIGIKFVLMDDLLDRRKAIRMGLTPIGTLGILKLATHRDVLSPHTVSRLVNELTTRHGMYLSPEALDDFLSSIGLEK